MAGAPWSRIIGHGLLGFAVGLAAFGILYIVTVRGRVAQTTDPVWLALLLATILVPAVVAAFIGARRPEPETAG